MDGVPADGFRVEVDTTPLPTFSEILEQVKRQLEAYSYPAGKPGLATLDRIRALDGFPKRPEFDVTHSQQACRNRFLTGQYVQGPVLRELLWDQDKWDARKEQRTAAAKAARALSRPKTLPLARMAEMFDSHWTGTYFAKLFNEFRDSMSAPYQQDEELWDVAAARRLAGVDFDTVVGIGVSGHLALPLLARRMRVKMFALRKPGVNSHTPSQGTGVLGRRWLFVDDCVDSGHTLRLAQSLIDKFCDYAGWHTQYVGAYLYERGGFYPPGQEGGY